MNVVVVVVVVTVGVATTAVPGLVRRDAALALGQPLRVREVELQKAVHLVGEDVRVSG